MKGLLQSKRFKKNLKKWLCMYVGTLVLLTTVVTYSKYISELGGSDGARITKFNVIVESEKKEGYICSTGNDSVSCSAEGDKKYRPTKSLSYQFTLKPDFEVNTILATTVYVPSDFEIISLKEVGGNELYNIENKNAVPSYVQLGTIETNNTITANIITITRDIKISEEKANDPITYEINVKYLYDERKYTEALKENVEVIKVGYSATQKKN